MATTQLDHAPAISTAQIRRRFVSIETWCELSGISRRQTYERIAQGKLRAVKDGHKTLIDMETGERYLAERPELKVRPMARQEASGILTLESLGLE